MRLNKNKVLLAIARKEMNQTELADNAKMSRGNLSTIMNGKNCRPETVIRLAKICFIVTKLVKSTHINLLV